MSNERMTCQICGRKILAKNGKIAHHGYRRPGEGWQTASCEGARHLPLEVSNRVLDRHVNDLIANVDRLSDWAVDDITEVRYERRGKMDMMTGKREIHVIKITEENFEEHQKSINYQRSGRVYAFSEAGARADWDSRFGAGAFDQQELDYQQRMSMEGLERIRRKAILKQEIEYLKYQAARLAESVEILGGVK